MSLSIALWNAVSGLQANSRSLDVTAQNVSNVNTEGYSRKIVQQQAVVIAGQGAGVQISEISRTVNDFMIREVRTALSQIGDVSVRDEYYDRMQSLFGTLASDSSPAIKIAELAATMQALADTPESASLRTEVVDRAVSLIQQLNDIAKDIEKFRVEVDRSISDSIDTVNTQLALVHELNLQIAKDIALGHSPAELQDQRDVALNKIAEHISFQQFTRSNGEVVLLTATGRPLLDRTANTLSHSPVIQTSPLTTHASGAIGGISLGGTDITSEISSGRLAGLIELRDEILPNLHSQFQELTEALHDEVNALHNQGTAYPGLASVTSSHSFAGTDPLSGSGSFRVTVTDTDGAVVATQDIDLTAITTVAGLMAAFNALAPDLSATFNADGKIVLTPSAGNRVAFNELDSAITTGSETMGASTFFGLNDFFVSGKEYDTYSSSHQASRTTALGQTGTMTFSGGFGAANIAYAAGNSLDDIAAAINGDATLAAAGITASVVTDGTGYRLRIADSGGDNVFITDSGNLANSLNIRPYNAGIVADISVRTDIRNDPSLLARGTLSPDPALAVGDTAVTAGDKSAIQAIANQFNARLSFDATNLLPGSSSTLSEFASEILSLNATQANATSQSLDSREILLENLKAKTAAVSGVNLDEEMSHMIVLENAYAASARVITVTQNLFDLLSNLLK